MHSHSERTLMTILFVLLGLGGLGLLAMSVQDAAVHGLGHRVTWAQDSGGQPVWGDIVGGLLTAAYFAYRIWSLWRGPEADDAAFGALLEGKPTPADRARLEAAVRAAQGEATPADVARLEAALAPLKGKLQHG